MSRACDDDNVVINREPTSDSSARSVLFSPLNISILPSPSHSYKSPLSLSLGRVLTKSSLSLAGCAPRARFFRDGPAVLWTSHAAPCASERERERALAKEEERERDGESPRPFKAFQSTRDCSSFSSLPLSLSRERDVFVPHYTSERARAHIPFDFSGLLSLLPLFAYTYTHVRKLRTRSTFLRATFASPPLFSLYKNDDDST